MPYDLALYDLISPYVLRGDTFGQWHAALSVLYVAEHTIVVDDTGIVIRGTARFSANVSPYIDPSSMSFGVNAENTEGHPANDPGRRDPWIDIHDAHIDFELSAPRVASQKVATAVAAIGASSGFTNAAAVLTDYGVTTAGTIPSDYPSTEFTLDLLLTTIVLRPPFLIGAKLDPSGILVADPGKAQVKISLPKLKARLSQGSGVNDPLTATLLSFGASSLDDTDDIGVAQLITMDPPYAFIGSSKTVGIGFRSATLDLSDGSTPPDVLAQFGYDDSWTGLYLPEIRLYVAPQGAENLAFDASATNLLIGFGKSAGVTGDFELQVVDQGSGTVHVGARFYDDGGQGYSITRGADGSTATVTLPKKTRMILDVDGGLTPYTSSAQIGSAPDTPGRLFEDVDFGSATSLTIVLTAKGAQPGATPTKLTITAALQSTSASAPVGTTGTPANPQANIKTQVTKQGGSTVASPTLKVVSQTSTQVTVAVDTDATTAATTQWTVGGAARGTSATLTLDCNPGDTVNLTATLPGQSGVTNFTAYYRFDHPKPNVDNPATFTVVPDNTHTTPAADEGLSSPWPGGSDVITALSPILDTLPAGTAIHIDGFASFESKDDPGPNSNDRLYNTQLALNRAQGLQSLITQQYKAKTFTYPATQAQMGAWTSQTDPGRNLFWKAVASWPPTTTAQTEIDATLGRDPVTAPPPAPVPDNPKNPQAPPPPSWFKSIDVKVRIVRDHFVACEIDGKFDIQTPSENALAQGGLSQGQVPQWGDAKTGTYNPSDGIVEAKIIVQIDDATDDVTVTGSFGADPADKDGLKMIGWLPPYPSPAPALPGYGQNFMGLGIAFWPLIADAAGSVANDGAPVELAVTAAGFAVVAGMAALTWFRVEHIIWYGGEFDLQVRPDGTQLMLLFDLEVAISADIAPGFIDILTIPRATPMVVRYKAVGILLGNPPGQPKFQFRPYFDSSKGYTIDVSKPGAIQVHPPFDSILKILGARISRNNPFFVEVDLGFAVDLGVVSIDRARVRLNLSPGGPPQLTAFGASVDIPGALRGSGSLSMGNDSGGNMVIAGSLDLTIVPVQVRIAATLEIAQIPPANGGPATGVKVTLEVDFPVAIPLGASGLGIYGFIGLFAVNFQRDETPYASSATPALAWLKAMGGDPTNNAGWVPKVNTWALGVGALLGTEGSDVLFNLKGMFILELPGPRLLLMMKANLLIPPSALHSAAEGMFLAVIDLDFGRGTLTIGLAVAFEVDPLLKIQIPVEAFFNFNDTSDWHLYLGQYSTPVQATVLSVFDASGYLMLSGKGIPAHTGLSGGALPAVTGFSIATGLHVSFTWGGGPLYAQLSAGFDAVVGFSPFRMAGTMTVRGTLHLFIIDISAWADLTVDVGDDGQGGHIAQISGDICGKVDFLFFSVSGCVSFSLGGDSIPAAPAPPLASGLKLVSRSPALVQGTGSSDKPIDSSLGNAVEDDAATNPGGLGNDGKLPVVPIDVVPALMLVQPPQADGLQFLGKSVGGSPHGPSDGWVQRGDMWYSYQLNKVELIGGVSAGATPAVWWNTSAGDKALEAQLALLSWVPDPTPKAVGSSKSLDQTVAETWGNVCQQAAPPAPVFWTFFFQPLGTSTAGWKPYGAAYPDPPNTVRSSPADTTLKVTERWRCGNIKIDNLTGVVPAEVEGAAVGCPNRPNPVSAPSPAASPQSVLPGPASSFIPVATLTGTGRVALPASPRDLYTGPLNPVLALRGGTAVQTIDTALNLRPDQALGRIMNGEALSRSALSNFSAGGQAAPAQSQQCFGWALASPLFDSGTPDEQGLCPFPAAVQRGWNAQYFRPGPLDNAVIFDFGGEFEYARFFLWVPERLAGGSMIVVAASDAKDNLSNQHAITFADHTAVSALPATWTATTSLWQQAVFVVQEEAALAQQYTPVFVEIKGAPGATRVQIGCTKASAQIRALFGLRPFYVGAIEALKRAETVRSAFDTRQQTSKQGVINDALGLNSTDNALLLPGVTYQVKLSYTANSQQRTAGKDPSAVTTTTPTQSFWFQTDSTPPARLDPWVLVALPGEAEKHYFGAEPVKVVFATNNVNLLYGTYGKKLQARLRPSSYVPVKTPPAVPHPMPLNSKFMTPVAGSVLSPWENAVRKATANLPCINGSGATFRHTQLTIPIPLDRFTDYLIDIEMLDKAAADGSNGTVVWRGSFSTGAFATEADFASSFGTAKVNHRGVHTDDMGKLQAIPAQFATRPPQGAEFDSALIAAGLDALPVPKSPAFTVFWEAQSPAPQPVAILVDSSEPMFRSRPLPTQITDPGPSAAQWYELQPQPWLQLAQNGGDNVVQAIVVAPGGQRALVVLAGAARGKHVALALEHIAYTAPYLDGAGAVNQFHAVLDILLTAAPWEEVD